MNEQAEDEQYGLLLRLEELESLLEDLDESGEDGIVEQRMREFGLGSRDELTANINALHARLDADE